MHSANRELMDKQDAVLKVLNRFGTSSWEPIAMIYLIQYISGNIQNGTVESVRLPVSGGLRRLVLNFWTTEMFEAPIFTNFQDKVSDGFWLPRPIPRRLSSVATHEKVWTSKPNLVTLNKTSRWFWPGLLYPLIPIFRDRRLWKRSSDQQSADYFVESGNAISPYLWLDRWNSGPSCKMINDGCMVRYALWSFVIALYVLLCSAMCIYLSASRDGWTQEMWVSISNESFTIRTTWIHVNSTWIGVEWCWHVSITFNIFNVFLVAWPAGFWGRG